MNQEELKEFYEIDVDANKVFYVHCGSNGDVYSKIRFAYANSTCDALRFLDDGDILKIGGMNSLMKQGDVVEFFGGNYAVTSLMKNSGSELDTNPMPKLCASYDNLPNGASLFASKNNKTVAPARRSPFARTKKSEELSIKQPRKTHGGRVRFRYPEYICSNVSNIISELDNAEKYKIGDLVAVQNKINAELAKINDKTITQENIYEF